MPLEITAGDPAARAKAVTDVKYGGQEAAIKRAIAALGASRTADQAAINSYGVGGRQAITDSYNQLDTNLETNRQMVNRDLGIQVDAIGGGYRQAQDIANAAAQQSTGGMQNLFNNNAAYGTVDFNEATSPISSLAARLVGESANSDATYTGNLRNWAAQQNALMQSGQAGAMRERASSTGGFERELLNALATSKNDRSQEEFDFQGQLLDLLNERTSFESATASDFLDQLFSQKLQAANYNLSEQQMLSDAAYKQAALSASGGGGSESDLAERKFQLELDKFAREGQQYEQSLAAMLAEERLQRGIEAAPRIISDLTRGATGLAKNLFGGRSAGPKTASKTGKVTLVPNPPMRNTGGVVGQVNKKINPTAQYKGTVA
jgi:hypothetical protein